MDGLLEVKESSEADGSLTMPAELESEKKWILQML